MTARDVRRPLGDALVVLCALVVCISAGRGMDAPEARAGRVAPSQTRITAQAQTPPERWVAVSVATLWVKPGSARLVDRPACANPADPAKWVADMSVAQKRWL